MTNVMNLELADYQRSLQNLKEKLTGTHGELEEAREDGKRQLEKMDSTRKEIGEPFVFQSENLFICCETF